MRFTSAVALAVAAASSGTVFSLPLEGRALNLNKPLPPTPKPATWADHANAVGNIIQAGTGIGTSIAQTVQQGNLINAQIQAQNAQASALAAARSQVAAAAKAAATQAPQRRMLDLEARGLKKWLNPSGASAGNTPLDKIAGGLNIANAATGLVTGIVGANQQAQQNQLMIQQLQQQTAALQSAAAVPQPSAAQRRDLDPSLQARHYIPHPFTGIPSGLIGRPSVTPTPRPSAVNLIPLPYGAISL
ncbi:hypothetical protein K474DRAFT_1676727 [Panus rudis PR-1116 ss-1]|nr:hypothetical protein K474DRAFT_1676727 [Panus rudis PR-1116 ss-1]